MAWGITYGGVVFCCGIFVGVVTADDVATITKKEIGSETDNEYE